jgi:hypothetical protein
VPTQIVVKGLPQLHGALTGIERGLDDMTSLNQRVAGDLASAVGAAAPVLTGRLAASWRASATRDKAEASSSLDYAPVIEYGSSSHNIEGRHYAERTFAASRGRIEAQYQGELKRLCRKAES